MKPLNLDHKESLDKEYHYGLRTVMELFDIGPLVAVGVLSVVFVIFLIGLVIFFQSAPPSTLTISSGPEGTSFHKIALRYAKILEKSGVKVNVLPSNGSLQNLERLTDPKSKVQLALVQGGLTNDDQKFDNLVSLGGVSYQPIMVFYRGKPIELLSELKGKTIAIGQEGSGTRKLATKLLGVNGIRADDGASHLVDMDADDATAALGDKKIDAAFIMTESASWDDLKKLLHESDLHLLNFKQATAYSRRIDYLNVLELPEGGIDYALDIPNKDITLVGPMVELIAVNTLHPALSDLILDAATEIHSRPGIYQKRGEFPMQVEHAVKMSEDAVRFYKSGKSLFYRYLPFWLASLVSRFLVVFLPMALFLIPAVRSVPAFFRWRTQMRIRRRYRELLLIEEEFKSDPDRRRMEVLRKGFDRIDKEIGGMRVRAAYADQFYSLRGHIDYVRGLMGKTLA